MEKYTTIKNKQVSCFVTEEEHDKISKKATEADRTVSNMVRRTILKSINVEEAE